MSKTREIERKIDRQIEIEQDIEAVWKALTDAEELMRWFPLDARTKPGPGGSIWFSWGPPYEGENRIEIWDPPRRLKLKDAAIGSHDIDEASKGVPGEGVQAVEPPGRAQLAMDFTLENKGGKTVLRLVHSGFGAGADWDEQFDGTSRGWEVEFLNLKHYLEHHAGQDRRVVWARTKVELPREQVWERMMSADGVNLQGVTEEDSFDRMTASGERLQGRVLFNRPPKDFCAVLENWNSAFLMVRTEQWSKPRLHIEPNVWLSTYDVMNFQVITFQTNWTKLLARLFPKEFQE